MGKSETTDSRKKTRKKTEVKDLRGDYEMQALADWGAPKPDPEKLRKTAKILRQLVS